MTRFVSSIPRLVVLAVCGFLVAMVVSVGAAGPACACSCVDFTVDQAVARSAGVFVGRATDKVSAGSEAIYQFAVTEVFKGDIGPVTTVGAVSESSSCGVTFEVGQDYLLFVTDGQGIGRAFETGLCHKPSPNWVSDIRGQLEQVLGPPHPPEISAPTKEITWWTRATAAVPVPLMALASVVVLATLWWTVTIVRRRRRTSP
ncbi:hypothetical protein [Williamsia sp. D3]|uniref:hypothetical protein n=1 Tax=Williamsia sp. D3 TaxID=1313067 RepID=UPI0003D2FE16|nr:hypothetical protein [Williamsia sp. D3]ETD32274.1 hypothetical protein W823_14395 [Williamsia sp. D3]PZT97176.1 MAG: hypothetical protein DI630_22220 [Gordonia sp. (in: high G+C Gram-positive bacteria)]